MCDVFSLSSHFAPITHFLCFSVNNHTVIIVVVVRPVWSVLERSLPAGVFSLGKIRKLLKSVLSLD